MDNILGVSTPMVPAVVKELRRDLHPVQQPKGLFASLQMTDVTGLIQNTVAHR